MTSGIEILSSDPSPTAPTVRNTATRRNNCGSTTSWSDPSSGLVWGADAFFTSGDIFINTGVDIADTQQDTLYQSHRFFDGGPGSIYTYKLPMPAGKYTVNLYFAEIFFTLTGKVVFTVRVQGYTVVSNLDVFAVSGFAKAYRISTTAPVSGSELLISLVCTMVVKVLSIININIIIVCNFIT
jgi:hypothetical protein